MRVLHLEWPLRAEKLSCPSGGDRIFGCGSGGHSRANNLLASCLGLVTEEVSSPTAQPAHFTLPEYLLRDSNLFYNPHLIIEEVCLPCLWFKNTEALAPTLLSDPSTIPLLEYRSFYLGAYRRGIVENVAKFTFRLLDRFCQHISAQLLLLRYNQDRFWDIVYYWRGGVASGCRELDGVSYLVGIMQTAATILEIKD